MNEARDTFKQRNSEIEAHLDLVKQYEYEILSGATITSEQFSIIKASSFLLIYNLIETSITKSIKDLSDHISSLTISHIELSDAILNEWVKTSFHQKKGDIISNLHSRNT